MRRALVVVAIAVAALAAGAYWALGRGEEPLRRTPVPTLLPGGELTIAVQDDQLPVADPATLSERMDLVDRTGVTVTRLDVLWQAVAPTRPANGRDHADPAYRWERYDTVVAGLAERGVEVMLNVYQTPAWANGGKGVEWAPTDLDAYGDFIFALATRYDGASSGPGGNPLPRVRLFEPWNEPNIPLFVMPQWEGSPDAPVPASPRIYAGMLNRAFDEIHRAQPDAVVIGPCTGPTGKDKPPDGSIGVPTFVRELATFDPKMDALSQHIYPAAAPDAGSKAIPSYGTLPQLVELLDPLAPGAPILITEMGYTTAPTPFRATAVTEEEQARYLPQAMAALAAEPRIRLAVWFNLQDNPSWPGGLVRYDAERSRKAAWQVFVDHPKRVASGTGP